MLVSFCLRMLLEKKKKEQTYQNGLEVAGSLCSCDAQCARKMEIDHNL